MMRPGPVENQFHYDSLYRAQIVKSDRLLGGTVIPGSPTAFAKFISEDTEKWAKVIKFAGIKPM